MTPLSNFDQVYSRFSLGDLAIFKCYLLAWGILFGIWIPALRTLSLWVLVVVFVLLMVYFLYRFFLTPPPVFSDKGLFARSLAIFHGFNLVEIGAYKIMLMILGLVLLHLFPLLLTLHIGRYIAVGFFGLGYFIYKVART